MREGEEGVKVTKGENGTCLVFVTRTWTTAPSSDITKYPFCPGTVSRLDAF